MFMGLWRDLVHAGRSLAKARAFTFVCVVSLGIGMAPVIAIPYAARVLQMPPPGVNTDGLVELVTTARGWRDLVLSGFRDTARVQYRDCPNRLDWRRKHDRD
jgi:hypothetical protein